MKKTKQFKILLIAAFVAVSSGAFAQVKIGSNPTAIGTNSNLEVEATSNKKVIVHKSDGTVVIENTPSGATTDSIMTVDASGNVRAININKLKQALGVGASQMTVGNGQSLPQGVTTVDYNTITFDDLGGANITANQFTVQVDGFYTFNVDVAVQIPLAGAAAATGSFQAFLVKSGSQIGIFDGPQTNRGYQASGTITRMAQCLAGDVITVQVKPCFNCGVGNSGYSIFNSTFTILKNK